MNHPQCPYCLFDSLAERIEDFEDFAEDTALELLELRGLSAVAEGIDLLGIEEDREALSCHLALAIETIATLKALVQTAEQLL